MPITVIAGEQRGDEGKGRFVDMLMPDHDIGARFNGGDNAGHTVVAPDGEVYKVHGLPTSVVHEHATSVIGGGAVINPVNLVKEMTTLQEQGIEISENRLLIHGGVHLILPHHILEDSKREAGAQAQGSTKSGIAPAYADKASRVGTRAEIINNDANKLFEIAYQGLRNYHNANPESSEASRPYDYETASQYVDCARQLGMFVTDAVLYLNQALADGARVLAEGAQAFLLDIDQGMYPYVTSSSATVGGVTSGLGVPPRHIERVIGVSKATQSHVGGGPFVTEILDPELLRRLHGNMTAVDAERGTTTGRTRRLGHLDLPQIRRSQMVNGIDEMALTKLDWVSRYGAEVPICVAYKRKGNTIPIAPDAAYKLEQSEPVYQTLPTWEEDIQAIEYFEDLPRNAQDYIEFIEDRTDVPITMIGVGPQRDQVIRRPK